MICAIHDKLYSSGNGTEFSDDEFVTNERIKMGYVFLKSIGSVLVIIVGIISDNNVRILDNILDIA